MGWMVHALVLLHVTEHCPMELIFDRLKRCEAKVLCQVLCLTSDQRVRILDNLPHLHTRAFS